MNTKLVYNQQKYNLLREESEGYAKVLTVLNNFGSTALSERCTPDVVVALQSLIGCFDLDPNRVFDLVLDRRAPCRTRALHSGCVRVARKIALHSSFRAPLGGAMAMKAYHGSACLSRP